MNPHLTVPHLGSLTLGGDDAPTLAPPPIARGGRRAIWLATLLSVVGLLFLGGCDALNAYGSGAGVGSASGTAGGAFSIPNDHTINEDGAWHAPGMSNPDNCDGCHGISEPRGSIVACVDCHSASSIQDGSFEDEEDEGDSDSDDG